MLNTDDMKKAALIPLLVFLLLAGCRSSQPVVQQFYLLELEGSYQWPEGVASIEQVCEVAEVRIAPAYATHQIAIREESHQIRYFTFNEWAERPGQRLGRMIVDFLEEHSVFGDVIYGRSAITPSYIIETDIDYIEVDAREASFRARIGGELRLVSTSGGRQVVLSHRIERYEELPGKNLNDFASSVSRMFSEELYGFTAELIQMAGGI